MKIILIGYPGSQFLVPASKYLVNKYLKGFDVHYLNYTGNVEGWSEILCEYLERLTDDKVILALDDYLISAPLDRKAFEIALEMDPPVKLCECSDQEQEQYPVTTQYTIWYRKELIRILSQTTSPWDFEINGSKLLGRKALVCPCIEYDVHSALSARWKGVNLKGLKEEDITKISKICSI